MVFIYLVIIAILIYIDQRTKINVERRYEKGEDLAKKTKNFLYEIIYTRNYGVALNVLERKAKLIIVINSCILAVLCVYTSFVVWKYSWDFQLVALILIIAGGIGNLIDRVKEGYVIDFIRFNFRKSPIFNIADFYIIIGEILFLLWFII